MDTKHKRYAIISISSVVLVAIVLVAFIGNQKKSSVNDKHINISKKTFLDLCHGVDFKDVCMKSLPFKTLKNDHDPKDLLKKAFEAAMDNLRGASKKALFLQTMHKENIIKCALSGCSELTEMAINDLQRSLNKFVAHDVGSLARILNDLLIWVSGSMTYQETCLDGFVNTPGNVGEHMKLALKTGTELTTNTLGMMDHIAVNFKSSAEITGTVNSHNRRLLSYEKFPEWLDSKRRGLLDQDVMADLVVAQDGSGKYTRINEALKDIPKHSDNTFVLYVKEGVYNEQVLINSSMTHLMLVGDGPTKTRITGSLNFIDGTTTYHSATVAVSGDFFIAKDIGFENTAGPEKHQAVALRVTADRSIFYRCQMGGYQDTLYTHTYRQFYRDCVVSGTIDFIFGDAAAFFQNCKFVIRKPMDNQQCIVTAQGRKNVRQPTGIIFQNCTITADSSMQNVKNKFKSYLGRPWKEYSRTVIMESFLDDLIDPQGFLPWNATFALDTLFYTEFNNRGPRSAKDNRVKWPGIKELTTDRIQRFTASKFLEGDTWVPPSKVPYSPGLMFDPPQQTSSSPVSEQENADSNYMNKKDSYGSNANFTSTSPPQSSTSSPPSPPPPEASDSNSKAPPTSPTGDDSGSGSASTPTGDDSGSGSASTPTGDDSGSTSTPTGDDSGSTSTPTGDDSSSGNDQVFPFDTVINIP